MQKEIDLKTDIPIDIFKKSNHQQMEKNLLKVLDKKQIKGSKLWI
jgi:hypothetical protein